MVDIPAKGRRRHYTGEGLLYIMFEISLALEVAPLLTPTQHKIVALILSDYREDAPWARLTAAEMCTELDLASPNFYRALKPLRESGLVIKRSSTMWQVNPHYGWRGSKKAWESARKKIDPPDLAILGGAK